MKITNRVILLLFLITFIPIVVFAGIAYVFGRSSLLNFVQERVEGVNAVKAAVVNTFYTTLEPVVQPITEVDDMRGALTAVANLQRSTVDRNAAAANIRATVDQRYRSAYFENALVLRSDTVVTFVQNATHLAQEGTKVDASLADVARRSQLTATTADVVLSDDGTERFLLGQPITDTQGYPVGVILFVYDFRPIVDQVGATTGLSETGETFLGRYEDATTALHLSPLRYDTEAVLMRRASAGSKGDAAMFAATHGGSGAGLTTDYRGERVIAAWEPLIIPGWGIVTKFDQSEGLESLAGVRTSVLALLLGLAVFLAAGMSFIVHRNVSRPLRSLAQTAGLIEQERFPEAKVSHKLIYSHDEFGAIANALHHILEHHQHEDSTVERRSSHS